MVKGQKKWKIYGDWIRYSHHTGRLTYSFKEISAHDDQRLIFCNYEKKSSLLSLKNTIATTATERNCVTSA